MRIMSMTSVMSKSRPAGPGAWAAAAGSMGQKPGRNATASNHSAHVSPDPVHAHVEEHGPVPVRVLEDGVERLLVEEVARLRAEAGIRPTLGEVAPRGRNDDAPDVALPHAYHAIFEPRHHPSVTHPEGEGVGCPVLELGCEKALAVEVERGGGHLHRHGPASLHRVTHAGPSFHVFDFDAGRELHEGCLPIAGGWRLCCYAIK
mmetsp:Transcript_470/g.1334  ORF Transcript_470/g.1334 Transcript_470/m.1334 type:complete len:204 (+) Transcript_470:136-747(+)